MTMPTVVVVRDFVGRRRRRRAQHRQSAALFPHETDTRSERPRCLAECVREKCENKTHTRTMRYAQGECVTHVQYFSVRGTLSLLGNITHNKHDSMGAR